MNPFSRWWQSLTVRIRNYDRLSPNQRRRLIVTLAVPALLLLLLVGVLVCFALRDKEKPTEVDSYSERPIPGYEDVILPKSEDAGEAYIDETLFLGDSNTVRLCNFGEIGLDNMLGYVGIGIQGVQEEECIWFEEYPEPFTMVQAVKMMQPRRIMMMLGTNNTSMEVKSFIEEYDAAYTAVHNAYPDADIIFSAVPPIGTNKAGAEAIQKKVDSFNEALVQLAREKEVPFLNSTEILQDKQGYLRSDYAESDGIHLSARGAAAYIQYVRTHALFTRDTRPTVTNVPTRMKAPYMPSESEAEIVVPDVAPVPTASPVASTPPEVAPQPEATPSPTPAPETTPVPEATAAPTPVSTPAATPPPETETPTTPTAPPTEETGGQPTDAVPQERSIRIAVAH